MTQRPDAGPRAFRALLGEPRWQALLDAGRPRSYRPGDCLVRQGDPGGFLLVLAAGRVLVHARDANGAELSQALRARGDLIGELAERPSDVRSATVRALDPCVARVVAAPDFHRFLAEHAADRAYRDYLAGKLSETVAYQMRLVHCTARQRVARLLSEVVALADPTDPYPLRVPLSQESMAGALGIARSTVAEQIAVLRADRALAPGPKLVVADLAALSRYADVTGAG